MSRESEFSTSNADYYINAVKEFADNVLKYGKDTYGPKQTPLFVDGLNIDTHEPAKWKSTDGTEWVISNIGNQQVLFRTLDGLTTLTGDSRYRNSAEEAIQYAFGQLNWGGLLPWGGHMTYNATADEVTYAEDKAKVQELKCHYPYYELMWEVDPEATKALIENTWNSHVLNWSNLDFNRHGAPKDMGTLWDSEYESGEVFFWGKGLTFINSGSDLYYAAAVLSRLSGDKKPLVWAKRLAHRYVETRNPETGIGGYQFSQTNAWCNGPEITGDRAQYQFGDDFPGHLVVEGTLFMPYRRPHTRPQICQMVAGDMLGEDGAELSQWAVEELTAWGRSAYRTEDHSFIPMLTDGTVMEGYVCKKDGYFGPKDRVVEAAKASPMEFWAYVMAFRISDDQFMWDMARNIAQGNGLGDIGATANDSPKLNTRTDSSNSSALFGFLELFRKTGDEVYLSMAKGIGDNILKYRFHKGFFTRSERHLFAKFDRYEPLALLHLAAAMEGRPGDMPAYSGGEGFYAAAYGSEGHKYDNNFIYTRVREPGSQE
ncbi:pectate lyase [Candidatus Poribacteria bacterium]